MMKIVDRVRERAQDEAGFSILELIVALSVFAVVSAAVATTLGGTLRLTGGNRHRSIAANLASEEMDVVRSMDFQEVEVGETQTTRSVGGVSYTVERAIVWVSEEGEVVEEDSGLEIYKRVAVAVSWPVMRGIAPVTSHTLLAPPMSGAGTGDPIDPGKGSVAVTVVRRDGSPLSNTNVSLTGPANQSATTGSSGAVTFSDLPVGVYTVSISRSGYVDRQWASIPSQEIGVTKGATTAVSFDYDRSSTLSLTLAGKSGGNLPSGTLPVSVANTSLLPGGIKTVSGSGSSRTIGSVFPYMSGVGVWVGTCMDSDPEGTDEFGTSYYPGAARQTLQTSPNSTTSATILMGTFDVKVTNGGSNMNNVPVRAIHTGDPMCSAGYDLSVGSTNSQGARKGAIPFGTWDIQITTSQFGMDTRTITLSPNGSTPTATFAY